MNLMSESTTKGRLLFLEHYLNDYTDEEHPVTAENLMRIYEENGYKANRSTIRDDIAVLQDSGIDIIIVFGIIEMHKKGSKNT